MLHEEQQLYRSGPELMDATATLILMHDRDTNAPGILSLAEQFARDGLAMLAPQAAADTWYQYSSLVPAQQNEPGLSSAMTVLSSLVLESELSGVPAEKLVLVGIGQGACLVLEYVARNPRRYGAVIGLSGGLIGPPGTTWEPEGSLSGTPIFIGCGDVDPNVPRYRVEESAEVLKRIGAAVKLSLYPGPSRAITGEQVQVIGALIKRVAG